MKIEVSLKSNLITIRKTMQTEFPFILDADSKGICYITYENGRYYFNNRLGSRIITKREIAPSRVRKIIREIIELRRE